MTFKKISDGLIAISNFAVCHTHTAQPLDGILLHC